MYRLGRTTFLPDPSVTVKTGLSSSTYPIPDEARDLRLSGDCTSRDHYARHRLTEPVFESILAATLHRFDIRSRAFRICKAEFWPVHVGNMPEEVA